MKTPKFISLLLLASFFLLLSEVRARETYPTAPDGRWIYGRGEPCRLTAISQRKTSPKLLRVA